MTVWMHKGGDIILRYKNEEFPSFYNYQNGFTTAWGALAWSIKDKKFFKEHCVYIGRF